MQLWDSHELRRGVEYQYQEAGRFLKRKKLQGQCDFRASGNLLHFADDRWSRSRLSLHGQLISAKLKSLERAREQKKLIGEVRIISVKYFEKFR